MTASTARERRGQKREEAEDNGHVLVLREGVAQLFMMAIRGPTHHITFIASDSESSVLN